MHWNCWWALLSFILAACVACAPSATRTAEDTSLSLSCRPWPAADRLFHQDARWLGADDAHSVDLGQGRILWLFGDTLVAPEGMGNRRRARMIRNSIGIQTGPDPGAARMAFFWKQEASAVPASFFPERGATWYWPGDGIRIGQRLLIFLTAINDAPNPLGFAVTGWQAVMIDNPDASPDQWRIVKARRDPDRSGVIPGTGGILVRDGFVYAYGCDGSGRNAYLARWAEEKIAQGDLRDPQWWYGKNGGWSAKRRMHEKPAVLFTDAQSEFGVYHEPRINRYVQIQTIGFGAADLGYRTALFPQGPWGALTRFYAPPEKTISGVLIYAAKPHDGLSGTGLAITYATNHIDPERLIDYPALYYPRMVQGIFESTGRPAGWQGAEDQDGTK